MNSFNSNVLIGNGVALFVVAIATSLTNGTLLAAIYRNPLKCFRTTGGALIATLAVTDLMTGAVTALNVGVFSILNSQGIPSLRIRGVLQEKLVSQFTVRSGILAITVFSLERFMAVAFPFFHRNHITIKTVKRGVLICCPLVFLASFVEVFVDPWLFNQLTLYCVFVIPFILICISYAATYFVLRKSLKRMQSQVLPSSNSSNSEAGNNADLRRLKRERKLFETAFFIVTGFVISFSPWFVIVGITSYCDECVKKNWYFAMYRSTIPFLYLNSALNPLVYAWRINSFRRSIIKTILWKQ